MEEDASSSLFGITGLYGRDGIGRANAGSLNKEPGERTDTHAHTHAHTAAAITSAEIGRVI